MADAHRRASRIVEPQPFGNLLWAPCQSPPSTAAAPVSSTFPRHRRAGNRGTASCKNGTRKPLLHIGSQRQVRREFRRFRATRRPLCMPLSGCRPIIQVAATRCRVAPQLLSRSSMAPVPAGKRPPAHQNPPRATARFPPVRQSSDNARRSAWTNAIDATGPYHRPCGTNEIRPAAILQPSSPRPRSRAPRRSTPRTVADAPATLQEVALAIAVCPVVPVPNVADPPSHRPTSQCCDNRLNSPNISP